MIDCREWGRRGKGMHSFYECIMLVFRKSEWVISTIKENSNILESDENGIAIFNVIEK